MKRISVLVADDNAFFRRQAIRFLRMQRSVGDVFEAGDGHDVVSFVKATPPDVVLLDLSMPGLTGFDILTALRQAAASMKVIIVSGLNENGYRNEVLRRGAFDVVPKDRFVERIPDVLARCVGPAGSD